MTLSCCCCSIRYAFSTPFLSRFGCFDCLCQISVAFVVVVVAAVVVAFSRSFAENESLAMHTHTENICECSFGRYYVIYFIHLVSCFRSFVLFRFSSVRMPKWKVHKQYRFFRIGCNVAWNRCRFTVDQNQQIHEHKIRWRIKLCTELNILDGSTQIRSIVLLQKVNWTQFPKHNGNNVRGSRMKNTEFNIDLTLRLIETNEKRKQNEKFLKTQLHWFLSFDNFICIPLVHFIFFVGFLCVTLECLVEIN